MAGSWRGKRRVCPSSSEGLAFCVQPGWRFDQRDARVLVAPRATVRRIGPRTDGCTPAPLLAEPRVLVVDLDDFDLHRAAVGQIVGGLRAGVLAQEGPTER